MKKIITFDIGGTLCKWSVFKNDKEIENGSFYTAGKNKEQVLDDVAKIVKKYADDDTKIGISSPTAVNIETGYAYGISGIENYGNFNLYEELGKRINFKWPIRATNDANAALMGTLSFEEQKPKNAVLITLGTGIGGALYINGTLVTGKNGFGGEFGYGNMFDQKLNISRNISTHALVTRVNSELKENYDGKDIIAIYELKEDPEITIFVDEWLNKLARFCSFLVYSVNPDILYLGGGISASDTVIEAVIKRMTKEFKNYGVKEIMPIVKKAKDAGKAGIYGAKSLWEN